MHTLLIALQRLNYFALATSVFLCAGLMFAGAFVAEFTIENRTGETILATPLGSVTGRLDERFGLPTVWSGRLPLPSGDPATRRLAPGEEVRILYDTDDIQFTEIAVEDARGALWQLRVGAPPGGAYRSPQEKVFVIDDLTQLSPARPEMRAAVERLRQSHGGPAISIMLAAFVPLPWLIHAGLGYLIRRCSQTRV